MEYILGNKLLVFHICIVRWGFYIKQPITHFDIRIQNVATFYIYIAITFWWHQNLEMDFRQIFGPVWTGLCELRQYLSIPLLIFHIHVISQHISLQMRKKHIVSGQQFLQWRIITSPIVFIVGRSHCLNRDLWNTKSLFWIVEITRAMPVTVYCLLNVHVALLFL